MRTFDYIEEPKKLLTPKTVGALAAIHEHKGKQSHCLHATPEVLEALCESARVQSTDASNRIEGIFTSDQRLSQIMRGSVAPSSRAEEEIAGYRDVLATIHRSHDYIKVAPGVILQLHRDLYRYTASSFGGRWKDVDNEIVETDEFGRRIQRFLPLSAIETPQAVESLCDQFARAMREETHDPLLLISMFVFDFVSIHPFNDGNGRMSRLLALLLLYQSGYLVGKYVSIERIIELTKDTYYDVLAASSLGWREGRNDYGPFVDYFLGTILAAYRDFEQRAGAIAGLGRTKAQRVEDVFDRKLGKITKADILQECPDISETTVERALKGLLDAGAIEKTGTGRATGYVKRV